MENINIQNIFFNEPQQSQSGTFQSFVSNKKELGKVVSVSNASLQKLSIKQPVIFVEIDMENTLIAATKNQILFKEIAQFPIVERDLSIVMERNIMYEKVETSLKNLKTKFLENFYLFDIYEGDKIDNTKKSFAITFKFLNKEKTLTDAEVDEEMKGISNTLVAEFNAEIRH